MTGEMRSHTGLGAETAWGGGNSKGLVSLSVLLLENPGTGTDRSVASRAAPPPSPKRQVEDGHSSFTPQTPGPEKTGMAADRRRDKQRNTTLQWKKTAGDTQ